MREAEAKYHIKELKKKCIWLTLFFYLAILIAIGVLFAALSSKLETGLNWWYFLIVLIPFVISVSKTLSSITDIELARFLDLHYPELEESTTLALKSPESLNHLQLLQLKKISLLVKKTGVPAILKKKLLFSFIMLPVIFLLAFAITGNRLIKRQKPVLTKSSVLNETVLPKGISKVLITVTAPAYLHKAKRSQSAMNLLVEEGSIIEWHIYSSSAAETVFLIFNDSARQKLTTVDNSHEVWNMSKKVNAPAFYQVEIGSYQSPLYSIEVEKDQPPQIVVRSPKQHTQIEFGDKQSFVLSVELGDDYGITGSTIHATVASGTGETVKFKQRDISFEENMSGNKRQYDLSKLLDLKSLHMQPGDELYFYVDAKDTKNQESRSSTFTVSLADTALATSAEGLMHGINVQPEYFRSQRQLIIETEKLIQDKKHLSLEQFRQKSNELGNDQKLLRLRYGKFLGEEEESAIGIDAKQKEDIKDFGNFSKALDKYTDKHDNAEDATYLEPELKKQLRATLSQMWKAELELRLYEPARAVPFEYKALSLLKDLQQRSRVYVAKTAFKTAPLDESKRLTGNLEKVGQQVINESQDRSNNSTELLNNVVQSLEFIRTGKLASSSTRKQLVLANSLLVSAAINKPADFLLPVNAMRQILIAVDKKEIPADILFEVTERAFAGLANSPPQSPSRENTLLNNKFSAEYRKHLKDKYR